jgi:hypothetical protein
MRTPAHAKTLLKMSFIQPVTEALHTEHVHETVAWSADHPCWYLNASHKTLTCHCLLWRAGMAMWVAECRISNTGTGTWRHVQTSCQTQSPSSRVHRRLLRYRILKLTTHLESISEMPGALLTNPMCVNMVWCLDTGAPSYYALVSAAHGSGIMQL